MVRKNNSILYIQSPSMWLPVWCDNNANFATARYGIVLDGCSRWNGSIRWAPHRPSRRCKKWSWIRCIVIALGESSAKNIEIKISVRSNFCYFFLVFCALIRSKRASIKKEKLKESFTHLKLSFEGVPNKVFLIFSVVFEVRRLLRGLIGRSIGGNCNL